MAINQHIILWTIAFCLGGLAWASGRAGYPTQNATPDADLDRAIDAFLSASDSDEASERANAVLAPGASFDDLLQRLRAGRAYRSDVPTGRLELERRNRDGRQHPYLVFVPDSYDRARRYPVRVYLHGGVAGPLRENGGWWRNTDRLVRSDSLAVFPASWRDSLWWQRSQLENLAGILDSLKRTYNVDENRVHAIGVSDGASGLYYLTGLAPTPWAGFLPFIGHPAVIANPRTGADAPLHLPNLANKPFYIVNVDDDRLYPVASMRSWIARLESVGVDLTFRAIDSTGHNTRWWPSESDAIDRFIDESPRDPLPDRLTWEPDDGGRDNRVHWLIVSEPSDVDENRPRLVTLERDGNVVRVEASGVRRYTLLLSPDQFDFSHPIIVETNGSVSVERRVEPSHETLLRWAARDDDRTMLFGAELSVVVSDSSQVDARFPNP